MLTEIYKTKAEEVAQVELHIPLAEVKSRAEELVLAHAFSHALKAEPMSGRGPRLIAEVKKASPSQGLIRPNFDPAKIARTYQEAGARALSVLTDQKYFQGHLNNIALVKKVASLPVLRKDFIASPYQVFESKAAGADAILLIVAGLERSQLEDLFALGTEIGLDILVEVHREAELEAAVNLRAPIIGVNNRDLATFHVDLAVAERLIPMLPEGTISVCESALATHADLIRAEQAGADAVLIGTTFCRAGDIGAKVKEVMGW